MQYSLSGLYIFYGYLFVLALLASFMKKGSRKFILIMQVISVSLFYGLRDVSIGADTSTYVDVYVYQQNWIDVGLVLYNKIAYLLFNDNWKLYILSTSILISANLALFYSIFFGEDNKNINLAYWALYVMPYSILMQVNIIRQGLALSCILLGFAYLCIYKRKLGYLLLIIGGMIHYSMFFLFFGFMVYKKFKLSRAVTIITIGMAFMLSVSGIPIGLMKLLPIEYVSRFFYYMDRSVNVGMMVKFIFYFANYLLILFLEYKNNDEDEIYCFISKLMSFLLIVSAFLYASELVANRFLLSMDYLLAVVYFYSLTKVKRYKLLYGMAIVCFVWIYFIYVINSESLIQTFQM